MTDTKVGYRGGYEQKEREGEMREKNELVEKKCGNCDLYYYCDRFWDYIHGGKKHDVENDSCGKFWRER